MMTLGTMALHLCIADFTFTHNFIVCDQLPDTAFILGMDIQRKFSLSYTWDKDHQCYIQRNGKFLSFMHATQQKATGGTVKSTLKIPPRHNGIVPIKISGPSITTDTAHFIADDSTHKGKDPSINIIEGIHGIKNKSTVNIIVSNYTNKHLTFPQRRVCRTPQAIRIATNRSNRPATSKQCHLTKDGVRNRYI